MTKSEIASLALSHLGQRALTDIATDTTQQAISARLWFDPARDEFLRSHSWSFATSRRRLTTTYTALSGAAITDAAGLIKVTKTTHGRTTGDRIYLKDAEGVTAANGRHYITVLDVDNFTLDDSVFSGTYTNGTGKYVLIPSFGWDFQHALSGLTGTCLRVLKIGGDEGPHKDDGEDYRLEGAFILTDNEEPEVSYVFQQATYTLWHQDAINAFSYLLAAFMAQSIAGPEGRGENLRQAYEKTFLPMARSRDARESKARRVLPFEDSQLLAARSGALYT